MKNTSINQLSKIINYQLADFSTAFLFFCRLLQLTDFRNECLHFARSTTGISKEIFLPREPRAVRKLKMENGELKMRLINQPSKIINHQLNSPLGRRFTLNKI